MMEKQVSAGLQFSKNVTTVQGENRGTLRERRTMQKNLREDTLNSEEVFLKDSTEKVPSESGQEKQSRWIMQEEDRDVTSVGDGRLPGTRHTGSAVHSDALRNPSKSLAQ
ncbi:hypothetical protein JD844_013867 [Phrynosoma platyrhinos]|uniref:Uncharacterized protein n=1 Tax=Phrynosoma platyrhinos TaxID=52577 RepID=A0ABQ7TMI5_PHRPL|nr:hypothetical protein JD844_013867 [Phrynosoma platyrhinos]